MAGEIPFEEIDDYTERWGFSDTELTLREYLGLTVEEETVWVEDSDEALEQMLEDERSAQSYG